MNDRELLELAAKAAGYWLADDGMCATDVYTPFVRWNPLTDDGDALRLAVELRLTVRTDGFAAVSASEEWRESAVVFVAQSVSECGDKQEATRRAIVRAAAEIGKAM